MPFYYFRTASCKVRVGLSGLNVWISHLTRQFFFPPVETIHKPFRLICPLLRFMLRSLGDWFVFLCLWFFVVLWFQKGMVCKDALSEPTLGLSFALELGY